MMDKVPLMFDFLTFRLFDSSAFRLSDLRFRCTAVTWVLFSLAVAFPASAARRKTVADTGSLTLKPGQFHRVEFTLDKGAEGRRVVAAFRAFAKSKSKKVSGHRYAIHITVNGRFMRLRAMNRSRLLNKRINFRFGRKGKRKGEWGRNTHNRTKSFEGSAVWLVYSSNSLAAIAKSRDYAAKGEKDPAYTVINITDLVKPNAKNVVAVYNVDPEMTLHFDKVRIQLGRRLKAKQLAALRLNLRRKSGRTYYTDERIAVGKENVKRYKWAQKLFNRIMKGDRIQYYIGPKYAGAEKFAAQSDEFLWLLQPTTKIPRKIPKADRARCPVHGTKGRRHNPFCPWRIDPINHPYQVQCMEGGEWYPSNAFHKGDITSGKFPDDGDGCTYKGRKYYFLREYVHMVYGSVVIPCLTSFSQAYVLTGDKKYAHKGCVLLARLAGEYPNAEDRKDRVYDIRLFKRYKGARSGMITDYIWATFCLEAAVYSYDAFFDYMGEDPELLRFLKKKGMPIETGDDLRAYIEDNLLRAGMKGLLRGGIRGNEGHHQAAAMACALVIDDLAETRVNTQNMVDYYYYGIGNAAYILSNGLTPDGGGAESPNYNRIKLDFVRAARLMEEVRKRRPDRFPKEKYPDIFAEPKARAMFDYFIDVFMLDYYLPSIGDCGGIRKPRRVGPQYYSCRAKDYLYAFQRYGDPRFARACTKPNGELVTGDLFEPYPADAIKETLKNPESRIVRASRFLDDYGVAMLESGEGEHRRGVYLNYASTPGHRQFDNLSIGLFVRGVDFLPDLGYPFSWRYRWTWDSNIMSHNTVTVDETQPAWRTYSLGGPSRLFAGVDGVHVVTAGHDPYPTDHPKVHKGMKPCSLYERTLILVDVDPERYYVVDLFAVNGGEQHDQSWHGPLVSVKPPEIGWKSQAGGTLAGPQVAQFAKWTDRWGRERNDFPCFLAKIRRVTLDKPAVWEWRTGLGEGDTLHLHVIPVGGPIEIFLGTGRSPDRATDWGLDYLIARRRVKGGGRSLFLSVLDAYQNTPVVKAVRLISENPLKVAVIRENEQDEITFHLPDGPSRTMAHRPLGVRVRSGKRDVQIGACGKDETPGYAKAVIRKVDYDTNRIAVNSAPGLKADLGPERALRIYNDHRSAMYRIRGVKQEGTRLWITLDRTAQLARLPIRKIEDGKLTLGARLAFANGRIDKEGKLHPVRDAYRGSRLGEGKAAMSVRAIASGKLFLEKSISASKLRKQFKDRVVSLWQYGVGDHVEVARIRH